MLATSPAELGQYLIDHDEIDAGLNALAKAREQAEMVRRTNPNDVRNLNSLAIDPSWDRQDTCETRKDSRSPRLLRQAIAIGERIVGRRHMFAYDLACGLAFASEVAGATSLLPEQTR